MEADIVEQDEPPSAQLPTFYKDKLTKGWVYPIGAKALSELLIDVPQFHSMELSFSWTKPSVRSPQRETLILHLVRIDYNPYDRFRRRLDWILRVNAIPTSLVAHVRPLLHDAVVPRCRLWLLQPRTPMWSQRRAWLRVSYNSLTEQLEYSESDWG